MRYVVWSFMLVDGLNDAVKARSFGSYEHCLYWVSSCSSTCSERAKSGSSLGGEGCGFSSAAASLSASSSSKNMTSLNKHVVAAEKTLRSVSGVKARTIVHSSVGARSRR